MRTSFIRVALPVAPRRSVRLQHGAPGVPPFVTLSIGIATLVPSEDTRADWLLGQADQALYAAKYSGRNRVVSADRVLAAFAGAQDLREIETPQPVRKRSVRKSA